jgi:hypothetical protein
MNLACAVHALFAEVLSRLTPLPEAGHDRRGQVRLARFANPE